jgi:hypothetical protein
MPRLPDAYRTHFQLDYVGKMIKAAKRRVMYKWVFEGDDDENSVVLMHTLNSGKKIVFLNGNQIHAEESVRLRDSGRGRHQRRWASVCARGRRCTLQQRPACAGDGVTRWRGL